MDIYYIGALFKLELIKVDLPAIDIVLPYQESNRLAIFSIKGSQSQT